MDWLEIPSPDLDSRFPGQREEGGFGFTRASGGPGTPGWLR